MTSIVSPFSIQGLFIEIGEHIERVRLRSIRWLDLEIIDQHQEVTSFLELSNVYKENSESFQT